MTYRMLFLALVMLLPFAGQARADTTGSVSGTVISAVDSKPMAGTTVVVFAAESKSALDSPSLKPAKGDQKPLATATTDKDGVYTINNLPAGTFKIEAGNQATGFAVSQAKIVIGQIATVNFKIRPRHEPDWVKSNSAD